jgi:putative ABC transport system substrate-binding protein
MWPVGEAETPTKEFWERLRVLGWEEGRNLTVERRWAEGRIERLPELMAEVLARKVDVIVTVSTPGAMAAKAATATVPIVAGAIGDPVQVGLAQSLARPGGNLTGLSYGFSEGFAGKWLELLRECVPQLKTVALLYNPRNPWAVEQRKELETAIAALGLKVDLIEVTRSESLSAGLAQARRAQGLIVVADPLTYQLRSEIASIATRQRLPMIASMLEFVDAGGLLSYGVDNAAVLRRMAEYVDKILRGAKPADLPIEQPTQLALAVNLKTAAALGIKIPAAILGRADKVIR